MERYTNIAVYARVLIRAKNKYKIVKDASEIVTNLVIQSHTQSNLTAKLIQTKSFPCS